MSDATAHKPLRALTTDHFRRYAGHMVLDTGGWWVVEPYFLEVADEIFAGVREVWLDVPEENAKTTNMAGLALYHADYTEYASVPMAAASREQTMTLFGQAAGFVARSPGLSERFRVLEGYRRIHALRTGGRIQVFAADDTTADGIIPTLGLVEELHRQAEQRGLKLYRTWRGKLGKRGGQLVALSTAGEPGGEYEEAKDQAKAQADEVTRRGCHTVARSQGFVLHQYALQPGDDTSDIKRVKQANPFSGVTEEELADKYASPSKSEAHWARMVCGIPMRDEHAAIAPEEWSAQPDRKIPKRVPIWLGLDLGWKWDTTAAVPLWLPAANKPTLGVPEVIVPPRDGTSTPPKLVRQALWRIHMRNPVHTVVLDPNAGGEQLAEWIESPEGLDDEGEPTGLGAEVVAYGQTNEPQAVAYERTMELVRDHAVGHPRDKTLTQHFLNATAKPVLGGRHRFDRPHPSRHGTKQDRRVIDCCQAGSAVLAVALGEEPAPAPDPDSYRISYL